MPSRHLHQQQIRQHGTTISSVLKMCSRSAFWMNRTSQRKQPSDPTEKSRCNCSVMCERAVMRYFERLSRRYSRNRLVVVSVIVTESHRKMVHVIGRVAKPGAYPLNRPLTVIELLVRAGGFAEFAKQESVIIVRYEGRTASHILFNYKTFVSGKEVEQNILLQNRDLIIVP